MSPSPTASSPEPARVSPLHRERGRGGAPGRSTDHASAKRVGGNLNAALNLLMAAGQPQRARRRARASPSPRGAATNDGRAVIIAAKRDTGKTTTVAHLVARGWGFVTDETVRLSAGRRGHGFPKPLSIKPGGRELVGHWSLDDPAGRRRARRLPVRPDRRERCDGGRRRPPRPRRALRRRGRRPRARPPSSRLHPADAVVAMMQETLDAERFGAAAPTTRPLGGGEPLRTSSTCGHPGETADEIETLFRLDPARTAGRLDPYRRAKRSVPASSRSAVGDRVVVHNTASGRIFALDAGGTRVWRQLGGWSDNAGSTSRGR